MSDELKSKTLSAVFWSFFERVGQQGIQFIILIVLARLLQPEEFGLIAMLAIFIAIAQSVTDSGFGQALIQKQDATHLDECSVFYFNILIGILVAVLLCMAAPWISVFYNQPHLTPLTQVLSVTVVINAFGLVQISLLTRNLDFKTQVKVSVLASAISGFIGLAMAVKGFGVWSLVGQAISASLVRTSLFWLFHKWRPTWTFSFESLRVMFAFGSNLLYAGLLFTIFDNIYSIVIGKLFSATDLGFYSRAKSIQGTPIQILSNTVGRVTFPVFSSVQDDRERLKRGIRKVIKTLAMVNFPIMIGLAVTAKTLVLVLLTEKWLPCVPYLQLLCLVGMLKPLHAINMDILKSQGRSDLLLRLEVIKKVMIVISICITWRWGVAAIICGHIALSLFGLLLNTYYTGKLLSYPTKSQLQDLSPSLALACMMGGVVYAIEYLPFQNPLALLGAQVVSGATIYLGACRLFALSAFMEAIDIVNLKLEGFRR